jgi:GT2 family glycosyltransferase
MKATLEIIYVLDDPRFADSIARLATSVHARFGLPFTILICSRNTGFACASNLGLRAARAPLVCFMNSDVFPLEAGWLARLAASLKKTPRCGAIGPRLLFEDGSVQHDGCAYQALPQYGGWQFVDHPGKGLRPAQPAGVARHPAITGACMLMPRDLALQLGGFDEAFMVGDFEDADLCRRIEAAGHICCVDTTVTALHAERQSQASAASTERRNITLYNAWLHQRRWFGDTPAPAAPARRAARD